MEDTPMPDDHKYWCKCQCIACTDDYAGEADVLEGRVQFLIDYIADTQGLVDGGFTFPDGEFWPKRFALGKKEVSK